MTGLSTYLRGLWVTYSVRMWLGWQTQCDVLCLCVSACINIRTRAAFASCFHGSDDTHSHISDCQEASVCIRANSVFTSNSIFTQCTLSFSYYYSRGFSYQFRCLWWRCYMGCAKLADQAQPSLAGCHAWGNTFWFTHIPPSISHSVWSHWISTMWIYKALASQRGLTASAFIAF